MDCLGASFFFAITIIAIDVTNVIINAHMKMVPIVFPPHTFNAIAIVRAIELVIADSLTVPMADQINH